MLEGGSSLHAGGGEGGAGGGEGGEGGAGGAGGKGAKVPVQVQHLIPPPAGHVPPPLLLHWLGETYVIGG